jgi:hypothetical protein
MTLLVLVGILVVGVVLGVQDAVRAAAGSDNASAEARRRPARPRP